MHGKDAVHALSGVSRHTAQYARGDHLSSTLGQRCTIDDLCRA
jgi:hypothetical protein